MKKTYKSSLILIFLIIILTLYLVNSNLIVSSILNYTKIYIEKLFPTSFIIYIISNLLVNYQILENLEKITKNPTNLYVIIMSMLTGFPSGPKYISDLYQKNLISKTASLNLLKFCHFPNPLFVLGPLSKLIKINNSIKILISIYLSNLIIFIFLNKETTYSKIPTQNQLDFSKSLKEAIKSGVNLQILIYGTNLFFYLITVTITNYIKMPTLIYVTTNGIIELTTGIFTTSLLPQTIRSIFILLFLNIGSISIHIQIKSILSDAQLSYKPFIKGRLFSSLISLIIFLFINFI